MKLVFDKVQQRAEQKAAPAAPEFTFELTPHDSEFKYVITIVGEKNSGKTSTAYGFPGKKLFLSFDNRSVQPLRYMGGFVDKDSIDVVNMQKYMVAVNFDIDDDELLRQWQLSCVTTYKYTNYVLSEAEKRGYDWIVFDCAEVLSGICEQVMRYRNNLAPAQGIRARSLWKERNILMNMLHQRALLSAKQGLIYTTYNQIVNVSVKDGEVVEATRQPAWYGSMKLETLVTLYTDAVFDAKTGEKRFFVRIDSKIPEFPDGVLLDITNKTIMQAIAELGADGAE